MKWLIIQSNGEHSANRHMRECFGLQKALIDCHQDVEIWGKRHYYFGNTPDFESYDVIFCAEQYEFDWLPDFTQIKKPIKIQWIVDLHVHRHYEQIAPGFHIACHATRKLMAGYPCAKNIWFPNAFDSRFYPEPMDIVDKIPIGFIGSNSPGRKEYIEGFARDIPGFYFSSIIGNEMIRRIRAMKIHWNKNISCDINYRTFETIGFQTCLLTNYDEDLLKLGFVDGKNCLLYKNYQEAKVKAHRALETGDYFEIGYNGYLLSQHHTYTRRILDLLKEL